MIELKPCEAIEILESIYPSKKQIVTGEYPDVAEALDLAINTLRRAQPVACEIAEYAEDCKDCGFCAQPANEPLTLEELRGMDKDSVYLATSIGIYACIVQVRRHRDDCGDITLVHDTHFTFTPDDGLAYRTKPEPEGRENDG